MPVYPSGDPFMYLIIFVALVLYMAGVTTPAL
jgi:hypothetical protein